MARTRTSPNKYVVHGLYTPSCALEGRLIQARFHQQIERKKLFDNNDDDNGTDDSFDNDINTDPRDTYPSKVSVAKRKAVEDEQRLVAFNKRKKVNAEQVEEIAQLKAEVAMKDEEIDSLKEEFSKNKKLVEVMQVELQKAIEEKEAAEEAKERATECNICFETKDERFALKPCGHVMCSSCRWNFNKCPTCSELVSGHLRLHL